MTAISISNLVRHPYRLNADTLEALRIHVAAYPYDQTARLLLLYNMYLLGDCQYEQVLRQQSVYLADRNILFRATEGKALQLSTSLNSIPKPKPLKRSERATTLIDNFLSQQHHEESTRSMSTQASANPSGDYMAYWVQQHGLEDDSDTAEVRDGLETLLHTTALRPQEWNNDVANETEEEITEKASLQTIDSVIQKEEILKEEQDKTKLEDDFCTETLAKIYIKQGRYERAIEILKALSARNPKKNSYFADQIRFLHKLVINNRFLSTQ